MSSTSPIGNRRNVKVFVLYLMQNVGYPMDLITINEIVMQTDYVAYLDFAEAFREMEDDGLIAEAGQNAAGETCYAVTHRGAFVVDSLKSELLPSVLDQSLAGALRFLDFRRRGVKVTARVEALPTGGFHVIGKMTERDRELLSVTLFTDDAARAAKMEEEFRSHPENIFRGVTALMAGNMDFLWNE